MEAIGAQNIRIMPDVLISGGDGANGPISGLLGLKLLEDVAKKQAEDKKTDSSL